MVANRSWASPVRYSRRRAGCWGRKPSPDRTKMKREAQPQRCHQLGRNPQSRPTSSVAVLGLVASARLAARHWSLVCMWGRGDERWATCSFLASDSGACSLAREHRPGRKKQFVHFAPLPPRFPSPKCRRKVVPKLHSPSLRLIGPRDSESGSGSAPQSRGPAIEKQRGPAAGRTLPAW